MPILVKGKRCVSLTLRLLFVSKSDNFASSNSYRSDANDMVPSSDNISLNSEKPGIWHFGTGKSKGSMGTLQAGESSPSLKTQEMQILGWISPADNKDNGNFYLNFVSEDNQHINIDPLSSQMNLELFKKTKIEKGRSNFRKDSQDNKFNARFGITSVKTTPEDRLSFASSGQQEEYRESIRQLIVRKSKLLQPIKPQSQSSVFSKFQICCLLIFFGSLFIERNSIMHTLGFTPIKNESEKLFLCKNSISQLSFYLQKLLWFWTNNPGPKSQYYHTLVF